MAESTQPMGQAQMEQMEKEEKELLADPNWEPPRAMTLHTIFDRCGAGCWCHGTRQWLLDNFCEVVPSRLTRIEFEMDCAMVPLGLAGGVER